MTTFCGIPLSTPLMNASGCHCSTESQMQELDGIFTCPVIVSKSCTLEPQKGNISPRLFFDDKVCINSMGLPNLGHKYYSGIKLNKPFILSIYPKTLDDIPKLLDTPCMFIEVNLSCPNVTGSINIGNYSMYFYKIKQCKGIKKVGVKLPPFFHMDEYDLMANLILKYEIDFIVCCNTIPNCLVIDWEKEETVIKPNGGMGGMSMKGISLSNVYNFNKRLKGNVDIIGSGGINDGKDVFEYILCGASMVQLGSVLLREGVECFDRIYGELRGIMDGKGYVDVEEFRGGIRVCGL